MLVQGKSILHVITVSSVGGGQSVVCNLANEQCKYNNVYVISSNSKEAWVGLDDRVNVISIKELQKKISIKDIVVLIKLLYWRYKIHPDIIHLHSSKMGMFGRLVFPKRKIVYTVHGFDSMRIAYRKLLWVEKWLKNRCRYIVGICKYDIRNLKEEGIYKNVGYVPNGVDDVSLEKISEANNNIMNRIRPFLSKYNRVIVSIARDDVQKKIDLFLELAKKCPQYAFVWIGNNRDDYVISNNTLLLGSIAQGYQLLSVADVFVLCSNYEGMPMSILEALSMSKPVVASAVGGVPEMLDGKNGYAVKNDVNEFKNAIEKILESEDVYQQYARCAREIYLQKYRVDIMVDGYDKLYAQMI